MAEDTTMTIAQNTREQVAFKLMQLVLVERGYSPVTTGTGKRAPMKEMLDIYAECLETVSYPDSRSG